ncbi:MAG: transglycosylase SLT domain-containing protein [bacterium]
MKIYIYENYKGIHADVVSEIEKQVKTISGGADIILYLSMIMEDNQLVSSQRNEHDFLVFENFSCVINNKVLNEEKYLRFNRNLDHLIDSKIDENTSNKLDEKKYEELQKFLSNYRFYKNLTKKNLKKIISLSLCTVVVTGAYKKSIDIQEKNEYIMNSDIDIKTEKEMLKVFCEEDNEKYDFDINHIVEEIINTRKFEYNTYLDEEVFGDISVGSEYNEYVYHKVTRFLNTDAGKILIECSIKYNLDYNLLISLAIAESSLDHEETLPGGERFNGYAYGAFQIENVNIGTELEVLDLITNTIEKETISVENITDPILNVKCAIMMYSKLNSLYNSNTFLTCIAYNMGPGTANIIIDKLSEKNSMTREEILNINSYDFFIKEVELVYSNPKAYPSTCSIEVQEANKLTCEEYINWEFDTYGSLNHLEKILKCYAGNPENLLNNKKTNTKG